MKTFSEWQQTTLNFHQFVESGETIDEEMFHYFLCVVPPAFISHEGKFFLSGEPDCFDGEELLYSSFMKRGDEYIYSGLMPLSAAKYFDQFALL